jgi:hypothetical protein
MSFVTAVLVTTMHVARRVNRTIIESWVIGKGRSGKHSDDSE